MLAASLHLWSGLVNLSATVTKRTSCVDTPGTSMLAPLGAPCGWGATGVTLLERLWVANLEALPARIEIACHLPYANNVSRGSLEGANPLMLHGVH